MDIDDESIVQYSILSCISNNIDTLIVTFSRTKGWAILCKINQNQVHNFMFVLRIESRKCKANHIAELYIVLLIHLGTVTFKLVPSSISIYNNIRLSLPLLDSILRTINQLCTYLKCLLQKFAQPLKMSLMYQCCCQNNSEWNNGRQTNHPYPYTMIYDCLCSSIASIPRTVQQFCNWL